MKKNFIPILIILIIPLILVSSWFHEGLILGTAESMIPFYRLESFQQKTENAWTDFHLGGPSTLTIASFPTWWLVAQVQKNGIPGFVIQAFIFWFIFVISGLGIYKLSQMFFPSLSRKYLILGTLFYWFNPLALVNVWNRFLYNYIVFYAILPILTFLYIKGLEKRNYVFAVIIPLFLAFFSYALTAYAFNFLTLFLLIFTCFFLIITQYKKDFIIFSVKFNVIILIGFLLVNAWWILPTSQFLQAKDTTADLSLFITPEGNIYTLDTLSKLLGNLIDIARLTHIAFYQNAGPAWANAYISFPLNVILAVISIIIFVGVLFSRKIKWGLFLSTLFLVGIFLAKGNVPPFGEIFQSFFKRFLFVQIFRDPFEKFSFLLILAAAPLFMLGFQKLEKIAGKFRSLLFLVALLTIIVLASPFFTGRVFTSINPPNNDYSIGFKVKVPKYYLDANSWLESKGKNFRFIGFPLGDEGITYKWEKGYQGVEPSEILFSTAGVTFDTTIPYYHQIAQDLEKLLFKEPDFYKVANLLNARYLLIHSDVDIRERRLREPQTIESVLRKNEKEGTVKKVAEFDKLTLWENTKWFDTTVYATTDLVYVSPQASISDIFFGNKYLSNSLQAIGSSSDIKNSARLKIIYPQEIKVNATGKEGQTFERIKKYSVNLDKQSDYELVLDNVDLAEDEATLAAQLKVTVDNKPVSREGRFLNNNKISFGQINLSTGAHEISIERPMSGNLVAVLKDVYLQANPGKNLALFEIKKFDPYSRYLVGFDYLIKTGQEFIFMFQQSNDLIRDDKVVPQFPYFNVMTQGNFSNFIHASGIYTPQRSDRANILFWADPSKNTEVAIKKVLVKRLIEPQPVLIKENSQPNLSIPQITYTKHNPAKYFVHIRGARNPFMLVFSELYNSGWKATFDDGTSPQIHFLANAYANGWVVNKVGDFNMTLEYMPQRFLDKGKIVSLVSVIVGFVCIAIILLRKKLRINHG